MHKIINTMGTTAYNSLRDYLCNALSPDEMLRMGEELVFNAKMQKEPTFKRYTKEELNAMLDEAERDFAAGIGIPDEEIWRKYDERIACEEQYELAEAV